MENEQRNEVEIVYENVLEMIKCREFAPVKAIPNPASVIDASGYIEITSSRKAKGIRDERDILVYILDAASDYSSKSPDFTKLLTRAVGFADRTGRDCDIVFVSPKEFSKHIIKRVENHNLQSRHVVEYHLYDIFMMNIPKSELQPLEIEILSREYVTNLFTQLMCIEFRSIPLICRNDPIAIWYGVKPGQIVQYKIMSDSAGIEITYRYMPEK